MKSIGIISHYHNSQNYGGILQAYALVKALTDMGFRAEQICWSNTEQAEKGRAKAGLIKRSKKVFRRAYSRLIREKLQARADAIDNFRHQIPHSSKVYNASNIHECIDRYDLFVTGSDQVWNMDWYDGAYFLDFVPKQKPKFSYSASMPNTELDDRQSECVRSHLKDFNGISVREYETEKYLAQLTGQPVTCTLDPTLLLSRDQWDAVCTPREIKDPYIFCYFLGTEDLHRKIAAQYAKKMGWPVVTLPHLQRVNGHDILFGNIRRYDVSPAAFISLIKNAECVITDSFHAAVFSSIYQKEHFIFGRNDHKKSENRIYTLTRLFGTEARFCDTPEKLRLQYLTQCKPLDYAASTLTFDAAKRRSLEYLSKIQDAAKEQMRVDED